ncbi:MAG TPA: TonB-dependent siderophore receptor [Candidatus Methylacidiphilales bacterium]|jgi:catecholate siderophore receptor|nr:TonB-dependent siderophore receptor [Candidatus Methylacidiphilales bacterium]
MEKSKVLRYGSASVMALVNTIMMAGLGRAADTASSGTTTPSSPDASATPPNKSASAQPAGTVAQPGENPVTTLSPIIVKGERSDYQGEKASLPLYTEPLLDTPQSITVIPQQLIRDQQATTLRDILANVPGISFQAGEGNSTVAGDNLTIRGYNARDDIFIDGIRDTGIYTRDPYNTEQVEVVKGPASAYEGYGETGGSVNLISKTPQLAPSYEVDGGVGTNAYDRESMDINQPFGIYGDNTFAFRLNAFHQYNEEADRNYVYDGRWGFAPSVAWGLGTNAHVTLAFEHLNESGLPDHGIGFVNSTAVSRGIFSSGLLNKIPPLPYSNWYGLYYRDYEKAIHDMPTLTFEYDLDEGGRVINQTRYDRTTYQELDVSARFDASPPLSPTEITQETNGRRDLDELFDNKTYAILPFQVWNIPNDLVTSLELSRETDAFSTAAGPNVVTGLNDPNVFAYYPFPITWSDTQTNQLDDVAWSLFDTIKFTPQWELNGGMRYDHLNSSYLDRGPVNHTAFARTDDEASWRLALVYKPVPFGSFYCGYGTSYNPTIQGVAEGAGNEALTAGTVNLPPEEDLAYELGTKWDVLDQKLSLTAALFRTDKTNARLSDPTNNAVYALNGKERVQGVEVDAAGDLTDRWKIFGGYVYQRGQQLTGDKSSTSSPGNTLPNTPSQTASVWTTYDLPDNFVIGTGFNFVDQRYALVNNVNSAPSYWIQQAMLGYQINKNVSVQLNVFNLWDAQYIDLVGAHQVVPGPGRTVIFSTSFRF